MNDSRARLDTLEGNPGFRRVFPFALQQVLAMFVTNMVPIGLSIMTGVANRNVARYGGALLVLAGLLPPVAGFMGTVPKPVIGGVLLIVMGQIMVSGIEMIAAAGFTSRNKLISAISLSVAIGFTTSTEAGIWSSFPVAVQSVFSQNVVAVIFIIAILLNLILPKTDDFG